MILSEQIKFNKKMIKIKVIKKKEATNKKINFKKKNKNMIIRHYKIIERRIKNLIIKILQKVKCPQYNI